MKTALLMAVGGAALLGGCASTMYGDAGDSGGGWGYYDRSYHSQYGNYDYNRNDPRYGGYYAENYYRDDSRYHERRLNDSDRVYRGRDNRYYCRRSDGTTGLIVGGVSGGVIGNIIAPGDSKTIGTLLGAVAGAAVGAAIDTNSGVRCR